MQYEFELQTGRTIYFSAVLGSVANVTISIGNETKATTWNYEPAGGVGVYHGNLEVGSLSGDVRVLLKRGNATLATIAGKPVGGCGPDGYANFNPYVGSAVSTKAITPRSPPLNVADMVCVEGTGVNAFQNVCEFNCAHGYCPVSACVCSKLGPQPTNPPWLNIPAYTRSDPNFIGLCNYACNLGYCPTDVCSTTPQPIVEPTGSPFYPDTCVSGQGKDTSTPAPLNTLCEFTCKYGDCPLRRCECTDTGPLLPFPPENKIIVGKPAFEFRNDMIVGQMCGFACRFGGCVPGACKSGGCGSHGNSTLAARHLAAHKPHRSLRLKHK
jgi:hypothetical protein